MAQISSDDPQAFHELYNMYFGKVYAMALKYLSNAYEAHDIIQEVFINIWTNRQKLPQIHNFEAWIITLTRNSLINLLKKELANKPASQQEPPAQDLRTTIDYRELELLIHEAVATLSARQKEVFTLSRMQGYSHKEIASQLGISVDVSREHLSKALHAIRNFLLTRYGLYGLLIFRMLAE